jgi:hypothetical protein
MAYALENQVLDQTGCYWTDPGNFNSYENTLVGINNNLPEKIKKYFASIFIVKLAAKYY